MFVLDTDHLSLMEWPESIESQKIQGRLRYIPEERTAVAIISFEEQMRGWLAEISRVRTLDLKVQAYSRLCRQLRNYLKVTILDFDHRAAARFEDLRRTHRRIGAMDLIIAAIVITNDATLLTRNRRDFGQIPGLSTEDWTV